jgi:hypothetical protein
VSPGVSANGAQQKTRQEKIGKLQSFTAEYGGSQRRVDFIEFVKIVQAMVAAPSVAQKSEVQHSALATSAD